MKLKIDDQQFKMVRLPIWFLFLFLILPFLGIAQSGPGGVSNDSDPVRNCRMWLDAGDLASPTQPDGSEVTLWLDKSNSTEIDEAIWIESHNGITYSEFFTAPLFRSDPAFSINGNPVVSFEDGGMLLMGLTANANLNTDLVSESNGITKQRTVLIAFRTGNDIASRQFLWEQGGGWRGLGIYIYNSELYIGVYDIEGLGFGYSYKKTTIQPNTTYIVSLVLNVANTTTIDTATDNQSLKGSINGENFGPLQVGADHPNGSFGVGAIKKQNDPIGIGGVNSLTAHESSMYDWTSPVGDCKGHIPCNNTQVKPFGLTGQFSFEGRIAEICYYAYSLNTAERIIVENYLAAKYFANVIANDKYEFQANYGHDVIGIGADANGDDHNYSKGDNLFEISVGNMDNAFKYEPGSHYLLTGHNGNPNQWTNQNTPDSSSVQRLRRTWRFDRTGFDGTQGNQQLTFKLNPADLPTLPTQNQKLVVLIDNSNGPLPNFSVSPKIIELPLIGGVYLGTYLIPDGAYFTIAAVKPTIQFKQNSAYALENDDLTPTVASVEVELNYTPLQSSIINTGVLFSSLTAINPTDYTSPNTSITITPPSRTGSISFNIINDLVIDIPPVKEFLIILNPAATDGGYNIGQRDTLVYKIYDDDPDPKATFEAAINDTITEAGIGGTGLAQINVRINGTTTSSDNRTIRILDNFNGTATYGVDYALPNASGWQDMTSPLGRYRDIIIPDSTNMTASVQFEVFTDNLDEDEETIQFTLEPGGNIGVDSNSIINHTINLVDINPEPEVEFLATNSEGFEAVSQPRIVVVLSGPSAKTIEVPFIITGGTATNGANASNSDYTAEISGSVIFPPYDTISYLYYDSNTGNVAFQVYSDGAEESEETIHFILQEPVANATLGSRLNHTYTIKDYVPFEWSGASGVGRLRDNTFWMNLENATPGQTSGVPQISTRPININQSTSFYQPTVVMGTNNQKAVSFDGNNTVLRVSGSTSGKSPYINTSGFYDSKSIFFVVKPTTVSLSKENTPQVIFEEGGTEKGLNIYLQNKKLYFQAWNTTDDDGEDGDLAPWGDNNSYAESNELNYDSTYVVSCHYLNDTSSTPGLRIFVNGQLQGTYGNAPGQKVGRLYVHSDEIGIGGIYNKSRFKDGPDNSSSGKNLKGEIGEMIYYNESGYAMNTARIRIIHNYLSARFNVPLIPSEQVFDLAYADRTNTTGGYVTYNNDVAGIGIMNAGNLHGVAQGKSQLKVTGTGLSGSNKFLAWGHNDESLTNTWPFSYANAALPGAVQERSGRVWRFSENNDLSTSGLTLEMNFSESSNATDLTNNRLEYLRLLVSYDAADWSNAAVFSPSPTQPNIEEGARVIFDNVTIPDGSYVALGNTSPKSISPLPVELLSFNARFEVDHVNLSWTTSTEHNNDYFEIERAGDDLKWTEMLRTPGAGNSTSQISYFEKDRNPLLGISYYRLKQVDFDGQYSYSDVVSVLNTNETDEDAVFLYPNPSKNGMVILRIPASAERFLTQVRIIDLQGKMVWSGAFAESENILEINYGDLKPGMYLIEIQSEIIYESKKLVIQ
ncbi:T9SS type A sorting domain-containing protein [Cryomorpha ignava]|uniref:T9SS type A sorting domain-containing protein n=1 Tax=Cryomorpha ignava TaxID=101383 RepID=A0A7K3WSY8_9FLAO|nr:T9SS type A sorting domain-containing protein [Cryomorpha ignava]NEN23775.1 T9SS type A sorting domain-containing protein [Cryomorpha ignava]